MKKIIRIVVYPPNNLTMGGLYALTTDGKVYWRPFEGKGWTEYKDEVSTVRAKNKATNFGLAKPVDDILEDDKRLLIHCVFGVKL